MSSGATLTVVKTAPKGPVRRRVIAQARWLASFDDPHIVKVLDIREDGYEMEYLEPRYLGAADAQARAILRILETVVWSRSYPVTPKPDVFYGYLGKLDARMGGHVLWEWWQSLPESDHPLVDTHGDPTVENLMYRDDVTPVLTDPLPDATIDGKLPPIRAVDMGKVLQSALGYENVKAGRSFSWYWDPKIAYEVRDVCRDRDEWNLACFFAAVHVARFIPYQEPHLERRWRAMWPAVVEVLRG